jgi:hypothetical protein
MVPATLLFAKMQHRSSGLEVQESAIAWMLHDAIVTAEDGQMLGAGYWMSDIGCWILDVGCWMLGADFCRRR